MESFGGKYLHVLQMLSKVPIKCPVTEVLYDSLSPSKYILNFTLFGDFEIFWHTTVFLQQQQVHEEPVLDKCVP
jgi:hypothetical protein